MSFAEKTISLTNPAGASMYGVIHEPPEPNGSAVIMFNIGLHYRVCHSRLFVRQARDLQRAGFMVARFDPSRVGYGHGEIRVDRAIDCYNAVQTGLFKEDALQVIRHVREQYTPKKIFLYGLCGGGLTAIIAGALDTEIDGVVFVAGPVTVTSAEFEQSTLHPIDAKAKLAGYRARLFSPTAWARFFGGKTSYRSLLTSLAVTIKDKFHRKAKAAPEPSADDGPQDEDKGDLFNHTYLQAFDNLMKSGKEVLFLMPELDRATYDFDRIFAPKYLPRYDDYQNLFSIERVPKANHTFSTTESTQQLLDITRNWLATRITT